MDKKPMTDAAQPPVVLAFAPHDPSGRNGLQAIVETVACLGGHCGSVTTALCVSGAEDCELIPVASRILIQQARSILEDMPVAAIVIGYAATVENLEAIHSILEDYPDIPVVCASTLQYWDNNSQDAASYPRALVELVTPKSHLLISGQEHTNTLTPNAGASEGSIHRLFACASEYVLTYQCNPAHKGFDCSLYSEDNILLTCSWHADQNTLAMQAMEDTIAAAAAAYLAHGMSITSVAQDALTWSQHAASQARRIGFEAPTPNRFFWVKK